MFADQFSVAVPARVSRASSSASQSETKPVLAASTTAPPVTHALVCCANAVWDDDIAAMATSTIAVPRAASLQCLMPSATPS